MFVISGPRVNTRPIRAIVHVERPRGREDKVERGRSAAVSAAQTAPTAGGIEEAVWSSWDGPGRNHPGVSIGMA